MRSLCVVTVIVFVIAAVWLGLKGLVTRGQLGGNQLPVQCMLQDHFGWFALESFFKQCMPVPKKNMWTLQCEWLFLLEITWNWLPLIIALCDMALKCCYNVQLSAYSVHVNMLHIVCAANILLPIDPFHMTSHIQKGGRSLHNSCSLCVNTCPWPQHTCSFSCYARGSYWFLTQNRMRLQTMRAILGVNSLFRCLYTVYGFDSQNDTQDRHMWVRCANCKGSL